jgi:hypothetical protein
MLPRVHNLSTNHIAQDSSGATTCPAAPAPAAQPGAAPGPPCVLRLQPIHELKWFGLESRYEMLKQYLTNDHSKKYDFL